MKPITDTKFSEGFLTNPKYFWNRKTKEELSATCEDNYDELIAIVQDMPNLFRQICTTIPTLDGWGSVEKACTLASLVVAMKPKVCVEIGVWAGRSMLPMAWAVKENGSGEVIGIDPYDAAISARDQFAQHEEFWQNAPHATIRDGLASMVEKLGLSKVVKFIRKPSEQVEPMRCQLIHFDASAGEPTVADAERFGPLVDVGGIAVFSNVLWVGGSVLRAMDVMEGLGFVERFRHVEQWCIMQRIR